jgi:FkbM family methyltransferase
VATNQEYDQQTFDVMARALRLNSGCIDVGAHTASILAHMIEGAPNGTFFAFEPIPELASDLEKKFRDDDRVHVFDVALSDSEGTSTFQHVVSNPGYSGLKLRRYDRPEETIVETTVVTALMDRLVPIDCKIDFVKVDVEGAELQVFRGGIQTLRASQPVIVFEHGLGAADYYGTEPEQVYDLLVAEIGLAVSTMERWLAGSERLSRAEFAERFRSGQDYYFMAYPIV